MPDRHLHRLRRTTAGTLAVLALAASAAAAVVLVGVLPAGAAQAAPPLQDRYPVEAVFLWEPMSDACGFPVTLAFDGTFAIKVFSGPRGAAREIDTQPATKLTYASEWGEVSVPFSGVLHTTYPQGTVVGAPARLVMTGNSFGIAPWLGPGTGRAVLEGVVVKVEDGFAITSFTELVTASGNFTSQTERICAALAG